MQLKNSKEYGTLLLFTDRRPVLRWMFCSTPSTIAVTWRNQESQLLANIQLKFQSSVRSFKKNFTNFYWQEWIVLNCKIQRKHISCMKTSKWSILVLSFYRGHLKGYLEHKTFNQVKECVGSWIKAFSQGKEGFTQNTRNFIKEHGRWDSLNARYFHIYKHTRTPTHTHTHTDKYINTHTHIHTQVDKYTHTHTYKNPIQNKTLTYKHTQISI